MSIVTTKRKITVVLIDRANYGRLKPLMLELRKDLSLELQIICAGTMLLDKYGKAVNIVEKDGFDINDKIYMEVEGSTPSTMAKSLGLGIIEFSVAFQRSHPQFVLIIGDKYEALGAALAAIYQNICLIHVQGGEVTGSIDESARHAITKLAHYHFPATRLAQKFIIAMGELPSTVFHVGCPSVDLINNVDDKLPLNFLKQKGVGTQIDLSKPYNLVLFHPITTEYKNSKYQMDQLLEAVKEMQIQTILIWPNIDAGSDGVSESIRIFREKNKNNCLHAYKNIEPEGFVPILNHASCAIGNSSSFVREASLLGTPVVLVGSRQDGREWSHSVIRVNPVKHEIVAATKKHLKYGKYSASDTYGRPGVSSKMAQIIRTLKPYHQKKLSYINSNFNDKSQISYFDTLRQHVIS